MPTGYTANIGDGRVTEFTDFALTCARAIDILVIMRDDPFDAEIPEFQPLDYHEKALADARQEWSTLDAIPDDALQVRIDREHDEGVSRLAEYAEKCRITRQRYESMLSKVGEWKPPTSEHQGLKKLMHEQLTESIKWDCGGEEYETPEKLPPDKYREARLAELSRSIIRHSEEHQKEIELTNYRNEWVYALRKSLNVDAEV